MADDVEWGQGGTKVQLKKEYFERMSHYHFRCSWISINTCAKLFLVNFGKAIRSVNSFTYHQDLNDLCHFQSHKPCVCRRLTVERRRPASPVNGDDIEITNGKDAAGEILIRGSHFALKAIKVSWEAYISIAYRDPWHVTRVNEAMHDNLGWSLGIEGGRGNAAWHAGIEHLGLQWV